MLEWSGRRRSQKSDGPLDVEFHPVRGLPGGELITNAVAENPISFSGVFRVLTSWYIVVSGAGSVLEEVPFL